MKFLSFIVVSIIVAACGNALQQSHGVKTDNTSTSAGNFGNEVAMENSLPAKEFASVFTGSDTAEVTISGNISASCKHSGCWMDLDMGDGKSIHVTFQDESFTIPLDAAGKQAIAQGKAIRELIPVETLQNYAREEGKSQEEVAAITQPDYLYEFIASGVLIQE